MIRTHRLPLWLESTLCELFGHPVSAVQLMNWNDKQPDGSYGPLYPGFICVRCYAQVTDAVWLERLLPKDDAGIDCFKSSLLHFIQNPMHVPIAFSSRYVDRFVACHTCGLDFEANDSCPATGYHVRNFVKSAEIKRQLIAEGKVKP